MTLPASGPGRLLERRGDAAPRGMTVQDRTRLMAGSASENKSISKSRSFECIVRLRKRFPLGTNAPPPACGGRLGGGRRRIAASEARFFAVVGATKAAISAAKGVATAVAPAESGWCPACRGIRSAAVRRCGRGARGCDLPAQGVATSVAPTKAVPGSRRLRAGSRRPSAPPIQPSPPAGTMISRAGHCHQFRDNAQFALVAVDPPPASFSNVDISFRLRPTPQILKFETNQLLVDKA